MTAFAVLRLARSLMKRQDGGFIPDLGAMLALIEKSAGRKPDIIIGKPYREIAEYLIERTGVPGPPGCSTLAFVYREMSWVTLSLP